MLGQRYARPGTVDEALAAMRAHDGAAFVAGGVTWVDLMKLGVVDASVLVDIEGLPLRHVEEVDAGLRIGALVKNAMLVEDGRIAGRYPLLAEAVSAGASGQIRNMASTGGNLLQRTYCPYFRSTDLPCNKRAPGSGCSALDAFNEEHAIFGWSEACVTVHPSDMAVALAALGASVRFVAPDGARGELEMGAFHRLPGDAPERDTNLPNGALVTEVILPAATAGRTASRYVKVRARQSYAYALVSVATTLALEGGVIADARLAFGGVAHMPWRPRAAEASLRGKVPEAASFEAAAAVAVSDARPLEHNAYKVPMLRGAIVRALADAVERAR